ncbi:hypothetical protein [Chryseobacterium mucoviscidosis]|uniref:hypothetical protein n=1 Tax=Chryseobacterium mucoviscidosis TaxID=1945581 RepID=UPI003017CDFB
MKTHFFGSCSGLLRIGFGKMGFFPKEYRTTVEEFRENFDYRLSLIVRFGSAQRTLLRFHFKRIIVNQTIHRALSGAEAHINKTPF